MTVLGTDLAQEIIQLRQELLVTRQVLDEIREELCWANNNAGEIDGSGAVNLVRRITSMSADPTARPFHVNDVPAETICRLRDAEAGNGNTAGKDQRRLF